MLNKNFYAFYMLFLACIAFSSCNHNQPENDFGNHDATKPVYTIMYYGIGGGDLDYDCEYEISTIMNSLFKNDVSIRAFVQMKYSREADFWEKIDETIKNQGGSRKDYEIAGSFSTVYRYEALPTMVNNKGVMNPLPESAKYGTQGDQAAFFSPDSIASFINYCKAMNPESEKYILIFVDHGGGFSPFSDYTKSAGPAHMPQAFAYDPVFDNQATTIFEVREGIEKSQLGKKLDMLMYDCCMMNAIENLGELTSLTRFTLASGHTTIANNFRNLIDQLYLTLGDYQSDVDSYKIFADKCIEVSRRKYETTKDPKSYYVDWVLTDMQQIPGVLSSLKTFTDAIVAYRDKETLTGQELYNKYAQAAEACWHYCDNEPFYDLADYAYALQKVLNDAEVTAAYNALNEAIMKADIHHSYTYHELFNRDLSYSINIGAQGWLRCGFKQATDSSTGEVCYECVDKDGNLGWFYPNTGEILVDYEKRKHKNYSWANSFGKTVFEQTTGWSRWMEKNPAMPFNNPPIDEIWDTNGVEQ